MFAVKHNIPEIRNKLKRLKLLVSEQHPNFQDDIVSQMKKATNTAKHLTPRSEKRFNVTKTGKRAKKKYKHVADGWTLKIIGGGGKDRVPLVAVIYNKFTHKPTGEVKENAKLQNASGEKKSYSLLEVLEYGSPPHSIAPVNAKTLHFTTKDGKEVFTKQVDHPGTKPYGMVRITRAKLKFWLDKLTARWDARIKSDWERK